MISDSELTQIVRNVEGISVIPRKGFLFKLYLLQISIHLLCIGLFRAQCLVDNLDVCMTFT